MSAFHKIERPLFYPGRTILGRTKGPVVDLGELIPGPREGVQGVNVYIDERETREVLHAWGWPVPEDYQALEQQNADLQTLIQQKDADIDAVAGELAQAKLDQVQVVSLSDALRASKTSISTKKPTAKTAA